MIKKIVRWAGISLILLFVSLQFVRPAKTNPASDQASALTQHIQTSDQVQTVLKRACYDCHSNETTWPWYSNVAPVSWFVIDHVNHGRRHLNFSEWSRYDRAKQASQLQQIQETVRAGNMPLASYVTIHQEAKLSDEDKQVIFEWAKAERERLTNAATKNQAPKRAD
jgi:hypothetical protein